MTSRTKMSTNDIEEAIKFYFEMKKEISDIDIEFLIEKEEIEYYFDGAIIYYNL